MGKRLAILFLLLLSYLSQMTCQEVRVVFSAPGGFYDESFLLTLSSTQSGSIRFTTNGDTPTAFSKLYMEPLLLDASLYSNADVYRIKNTVGNLFFIPESVPHCITLRAAVFDEAGECLGPVTTQSYFIRALGCDTHGLPVLSIAADSVDLFGYERGIFVPGVNFDPADSLATGNYYMKGREWERIINMEFYELDNSGINQRCGLRTHGAKSRRYQQKGMRVYAREEYGKKRFKHAFFVSSSLASFKHLNLRPFRCSHWWQTGGQEYLSQRVAANMDVDGLNVRQTVVFINGEYWGIYTLEESPDERYLEDHYDVDLDEVNIIKYWGVTDYGDGADWSRFRSWMETADLNRPEDSAYAFSRMDVPSFMDYYLLEVYGANLDWPQNNVLQWQAANGEPYRMMFYDGDGCFTHWSFQAMNHAANVDASSLIINKFMDSPSYRAMLYERYLELKSTVFGYRALQTIWDEFRNLVEGEVQAQACRFGFPENKQRWEADMDSVTVFFSKRAVTFHQEMEKLLAYDPSVFSEMDVYPNPTHGTFIVSVASENTTLVPAQFYDATGRLVHVEDVFLKSGRNRVEIDVHLRAGLYLVKIGDVIKRIVIQ